MDFKNVIQASAKIIRITELSKNDVVKLIDGKDNGDSELAFAVVEDVMNDGDRGFVQFLTIRKNWYSVPELSRRVIGDNDTKAPAVFPATKEEIVAYFDGLKVKLENEIKSKEQELQKAKDNLATFENIRLNENVLTSPKYAV